MRTSASSVAAIAAALTLTGCNFGRSPEVTRTGPEAVLKSGTINNAISGAWRDSKGNSEDKVREVFSSLVADENNILIVPDPKLPLKGKFAGNVYLSDSNPFVAEITYGGRPEDKAEYIANLPDDSPRMFIQGPRVGSLYQVRDPKNPDYTPLNIMVSTSNPSFSEYSDQLTKDLKDGTLSFKLKGSFVLTDTSNWELFKGDKQYINDSLSEGSTTQDNSNRIFDAFSGSSKPANVFVVEEVKK